MCPNKNCLYVGCKVSYRKDMTLFVYKINEKTLYAGNLTLDELNKKLEYKKKEKTLTEFYKENNVLKLNYTDISISDEEYVKYKEIIKLATFAEKKQPFSKQEEAELRKFFNNARIKKMMCRSPLDSKNFLVVVDLNIEMNLMLVHLEEKYYFYNVENRLTFQFDKERHYEKPNILWNKVIFKE